MTDLRKAAEMALEALEAVTKEMLALRDELAELGGRPTTNVFHQSLWDSSHTAYADKAIPAAIALREALEQPVDNVDMSGERVQKTDKFIHEPVAWMKEWEDGHINLWLYKPTMFYEGELQPLYTAPPKRKWVGLTTAEVIQCQAAYYYDTYANIEAKLKERNT